MNHPKLKEIFDVINGSENVTVTRADFDDEGGVKEQTLIWRGLPEYVPTSKSREMDKLVVLNIFTSQRGGIVIMCEEADQ